MSISARIGTLFAGNESHYGTHGVPDLDADGVKWGIKRTARTLRGPTTDSMWQAHLGGKKPLGVVPIRNDSTCVWGSIDIDDYDVQVSDIIKKIETLKLPLLPCRSKSGGLHLFIFTTEPVEAAILRSALSNMAASIGYAESEIFPKQTKLLVDQGDQGNWIVMPYYGDTYGGKLREQRGVKRTGAEMTVDEFVREAEKLRVTPEKLALAQTVAKKNKNKKDAVAFSDGPPCLQHLAANGVPQGGQNNTAFHMGVYFKRANPEDWKARLEDANQKHMRPPLPSDNLASVIRSLEKKDYQYKCKDQPMCAHCDAMKCRTRKFGVGAGATYPVITGLSKLNTEPALWFVDVEDTRVACSSEELQTYQKFHRLCMEYTNRVFAPMSQPVWFETLNEAMKNMTVIPAPPDIGIAGQFLEALETYLTNRQAGKTKEDLLRGVPWFDEEHARYYFRLAPLRKFLEREGWKNVDQGKMTQRIEKLGGRHHGVMIKAGTYRNCWWVPAEALNVTPEISTPKMKGEGSL